MPIPQYEGPLDTRRVPTLQMFGKTKLQAKLMDGSETLTTTPTWLHKIFIYYTAGGGPGGLKIWNGPAGDPGSEVMLFFSRTITPDGFDCVVPCLFDRGISIDFVSIAGSEHYIYWSEA